MSMSNYIVLIIDSDAEPIYSLGRAIWRKNAKLHNIEIYFLRADKNILDDSIQIEGDVILTKWIENFSDRIIDKTLKGFAFCLRNIDCKFVLRTNLSSFFQIPLLDAYVKNLSQSSIYAGPGDKLQLVMPDGIIGVLHFCSGSGYLISRDLISLVFERAPQHYPHDFTDDVWLAIVLIDIQRRTWNRCDLTEITEVSPYTNAQIVKKINMADDEQIFHYRINNQGRSIPRKALDIQCWNSLEEKFLNN